MSNEERNQAIYSRRRLPCETLPLIGMEACPQKYSAVKRMKKALADDKRLKKRIERLEPTFAEGSKTDVTPRPITGKKVIVI